MAALILLAFQIEILRDLGSDEYDLREATMARIIDLGPERAAPILAAALDHRDPEVRARALAVQRLFDPPPPPPTAQDVRLLEEPELVALDTVHRDARIWTCGHFRARSQDVDLWISRLSSGLIETREAATDNLRSCCGHALDQLQEAARSADREVAYRACAVIACIKRDGFVSREACGALTCFRVVSPPYE